MEANVPCIDAKVLDFYHLSQHVHEAKRVLFGDASEAGDAWVSQLLHTVRHDGYDPFWSKLVEAHTGVKSPAKTFSLGQLDAVCGAEEGEMMHLSTLRPDGMGCRQRL